MSSDPDFADQPAPEGPQSFAAESALRLSGMPDWRYLLDETYEIYRYSSSGGSEKIRAHMRKVRETISRLVQQNPIVHRRTPSQVPVSHHLNRTLDAGRATQLAPLVRCIEHVRDQLQWQYGYDRLPRGLAERYGFAELAGPKGPVESPDVILGLVLFAPGCVYPAHAHRGVTESYICLAGAVSENHQGVYAPGSFIFNPPEHLHRITVARDEPALLLYAWVGDREDLAGQKMVLGKSRRAGVR